MSYYSDNAKELSNKYNSIDSASLHEDWLRFLPEQPGLACDIGAGTGRDANWMAEKGWDVIAVEPEPAFREEAKAQSQAKVEWLDDKLPALLNLKALNRQFNLILLSAVWMHLPESDREVAFHTLSELIARGGIIVISLRHGSNDQENKNRGFYPVSVKELRELGDKEEMTVLYVDDRQDTQGREHVTWQLVVLQKKL